MKKIILTLCVWFLGFTLLTAQRSQSPATVALTGDIMMGTTFPSVQLPSHEGRQLFVDAAPYLRRAHVAAGNLEGTLCDAGETDKKLSKICYAFRTPTSFAPRLQEAGYDFLSMANNHAFDFGEEGVRSTMCALDAQGIRYAGIQRYPRFTIIDRNGIRYGFCAFGHNSYTVRHQNLHAVREVITALVDLSDIVIVSFHGGAEGAKHCRLPYGKEIFYEEDRGNLREFAHFCIDAGADVVFGHGPHVVRAVELYKKHFIAYSLGNFCTPYGMSLSGISGYAPLLELTLDQQGCFQKGKIHSFIQHKGVGPRIDQQHRAAKEIKRLTTLDMPHTPLLITEDGVIRIRP